MESGIVQWLLEQTGPVVVAVMALYFQQQNHRAYVARERENADTHRGDKDRLIAVLEQNTAVKAQLVQSNMNLMSANERLMGTISRLEIALGMEKVRHGKAEFGASES